MNGEPTKGIEDIVRRNVAALRSKANLTQQALADEMLLRGIAWTRETVAQVETTNRRLGFTEAIVVAACLDVPVARLTATGAPTVAVGESEWSAAYLGAAIAGTTGDIFPPESYASPAVGRGARAPGGGIGTGTDGHRADRAAGPLRRHRARFPIGAGVSAGSADPDEREPAGPSDHRRPARRAAEDGRANRAPTASAGDRRRRRRHRPASLVPQPRRPSGNVG